MLETFQFKLSTRIEFGNGQINNLGTYVRELNGSKVMILTDKGIQSTGIVDKVTNLLEQNEIQYIIYDHIKPNPRDKDCNDAYLLANKENVDLLIGLGGGSSMDTAKAVGVLLTHGGEIKEWYGLNALKHKITPLICIPTTAGTGSEITFFSVITDTSTKLKMNILDNKVAPEIAILDPELTLTLPPSITASTGMDALTHAIEAYTCNLSEPITDALALYAIDLIVKNLPKTVINGSDIEARRNMLVGSLIAGIAFGNSDVGGVHCMAEALGGLYDTPHGIANSMLLPYVFEYNIHSDIEKHANVAKLLGVLAEGKTNEEIAYEGVLKLKEHAYEVNIPKMRDLENINVKDFEYLAEGATQNVSASSNPRKATKEDYYNLFMRAYYEN
ncbi:alcohol dehydrogenase [Lysinibacillus contaminans]|uniref:Alcohol dehydrogenase n=1 Tax=Lysinibacillus contaminans TaxID=1293441 RepID=A0ABR5K2U7_9BACI|nr:iron-containing alcohol dehydrogenase [Lysinibacillus contaminans]KOS68669.1 alcohol dehydrogenase [Lysinibacillus contaminans]